MLSNRFIQLLKNTLGELRPIGSEKYDKKILEKVLNQLLQKLNLPFSFRSELAFKFRNVFKGSSLGCYIQQPISYINGKPMLILNFVDIAEPQKHIFTLSIEEISFYEFKVTIQDTQYDDCIHILLLPEDENIECKSIKLLSYNSLMFQNINGIFNLQNKTEILGKQFCIYSLEISDNYQVFEQ